MESTTVINVLEDLGSNASPLSKDSQAFLSKLKGLSEEEFNKEYMAAELSNHEFLRDLPQNYIDGVDEKLSGMKVKYGTLQILPSLRLRNMLAYVKNYC